MELVEVDLPNALHVNNVRLVKTPRKGEKVGSIPPVSITEWDWLFLLLHLQQSTNVGTASESWSLLSLLLIL